MIAATQEYELGAGEFAANLPEWDGEQILVQVILPARDVSIDVDPLCPAS